MIVHVNFFAYSDFAIPNKHSVRASETKLLFLIFISDQRIGDLIMNMAIQFLQLHSKINLITFSIWLQTSGSVFLIPVTAGISAILRNDSTTFIC
jgi:hypothetical protein